MTRSQRMKVVQNHQQDKANKAGTQAANSRTAFEMQCEKLEQLAAYRDEYWQRYSSPKGAVFSVARLQDFRTFINRLDQAIEQQRQVVEHARNDSEEKKSQWLYERTREKAIGTVVEKFSVQEQKEFDRKEQKVADEFSQRAASRHSPH